MAVAVAPETGLDDFVGFCSGLRLENREPMELYLEQLEMLEEFFAGARETLILQPKKNGKTALLAALALHHLLTVDEADVAIVAESQKQALRMFLAARGFVRRSFRKVANSERYLAPTGAELLVLPGFREIRRMEAGRRSPKDWDGQVVVYANDPGTFDGWLGTLGFIDEYHRSDSAEVYGLMREGIGPRDGQMITISTAGNDEASPLGELRSKAYALPGFSRDGCHRSVSTGRFAFHEWALDLEDDSDDLELVKLANPAPWLSAEVLMERRASPSMKPWQWDRFTCGKWQSGEYSAISAKEWMGCADPKAEAPKGAEGVMVGCDLSQKDDKSAFVPVWRRPDGKVVVHRPVVLTPPDDGSSLLFEDMLEVCQRMATSWPSCTFVLDPLAGGEYLAQLIEREIPGVRVATHSQTNAPMCLAADRLSSAIAERDLVHPDDPELNAHVLGAGMRWAGEKWRFAKPKGRDVKIDACIALAMVYSTLVAEKPKRPARTVGFS